MLVCVCACVLQWAAGMRFKQLMKRERWFTSIRRFFVLRLQAVKSSFRLFRESELIT